MLLHVYKRCVKTFSIFLNEYCDVTVKYKKIQMVILQKSRSNIMPNIACYHTRTDINPIVVSGRIHDAAIRTT